MQARGHGFESRSLHWRKAEGGGGKTEVRRQRQAARGEKLEVRGQKLEGRGERQEGGDRRLASGEQPRGGWSALASP